LRHETRVRVHYPLAKGDLLLRAEADWEADVEPVAVSRDRATHDFRLRFDRPFLYFKPVIADEAGIHWARGDNSLALPGTGAEPFEVWPHFFEESVCSVCNVHEVGGDAGHAVRVFYPPGYAENVLERYPVLYMQDGQNLFFPNEAFGGQHWKVEETLSVLSSMSLIRKAIVVGIYPGDRHREYTAPGYVAYGRFLVETLKPWIDYNYRTLPGARDTAVLGSSLGGVVSFYLGWEYPEVFGQVGAMSATFGYRDDLLERVAAEPRRRGRVYLDTGWPRDNYEVNRSLRRLLVHRGYREGIDLLYLAYPEAAHNEGAWASRAHVPFQFFFGAAARRSAAVPRARRVAAPGAGEGAEPQTTRRGPSRRRLPSRESSPQRPAPRAAM
jgi:enterochelin esterase-like enzyme